jgi:tRNA modification GTPase
METIFALSSGSPPAGIAVIRISGPKAADALASLAGSLPGPRRASFRIFRDQEGCTLDSGLALWFPGPETATGEDLAELHLHGGRAVVAAVEAALAALPGMRRARPGEFTRRAFANGRIDLAEAEGLADLLAAETEWQRRAAMELSSGAFSARLEEWRLRLLGLAAEVEAVLDFDDEGDVAGLGDDFAGRAGELAGEIADAADAPRAEALREGFRVALAGPPNAGKSTLFNALVESEAAITSPTAGTTRDVIERAVALGGAPFTFVDMAGLREVGTEEIETIGIERARGELGRADLVLWLGPEGEGPPGAWEVEAQADRADHDVKAKPRCRVSAVTGEGIAELRAALVEEARGAMQAPGKTALHLRQRELLGGAAAALRCAGEQSDPLVIAEHLRQARLGFDALVGRSATEDMLDALFGRFCIGK